MSIEITINEPAVTFGMLPVGTRFAWHCICTERREEGFKHGEFELMNVTTLQGKPFGLSNRIFVEVISLPPGTELAKPRAKMVRIDTLGRKDCFLNNRVTYRVCGKNQNRHVDAVLVGGSDSCLVPNDTLVQPCRVRIEVTPEYET